jgi:alkylation response protein AidB-like acyl-CoA dehydrogenase
MMNAAQTTTQAVTGAAFLAAPGPLFFPEDFGADERLMVETAEAFSRNEVLPLLDRLEKQEDGLMRGLIKKAGELGFCGLNSPEENGGLGLGKNVAARILEFLSLNASFSVTIGITSGISQVGLNLFGSPEQRRKWLPGLASGEKIGAYALSEPDSGTDALSLTTKAIRDGESYRLTGTKMWISNAKWADLFLVMAKVDGARLSAFLVPRETPGLSVGREEHKLGLKGGSTARLVLEDAVIPVENLLYEEGLGHQVALNALNLGRFKLAAMSLGPARDAMGLAAAYAQDRKQFGQPIARFGLIQQKFALMAGLFFAAEAVTYRTGALLDAAFAESDGTIEANKRAAEEFAMECSLSKVLATEAEAIIIDEALQCFGGYGFTEEFGIARHYRDARVSRIYEGTNEINRISTADKLVRRIQEGRLRDSVTVDSFVSELAYKLLRRELGNPNKDDQIVRGALSDLVLAVYAEQSARLRAEKRGGLAEEAYRAFLGWANPFAARAYQTATGEAVSLPAISRPDIAALAEGVYSDRGPLAF